jgi:predicted O-methyltransferase YrrM
MTRPSYYQRATNIRNQEGIVGLLKKSASWATKNFWDSISSFYVVHQFRIHSSKIEGKELTFDFASEYRHGLISPAQVKSEFLSLLGELDQLKPKSILEIGTAKGGTLFLFCRLSLDPEGMAISVDLPGGRFGGGYARWRTRLYRTFVSKKQEIFLLRVDSHDSSSLSKVHEILGGRKIDFLFIDGDHSYEGVKRDFQLYSPLVREDGIIALHDIAKHQGIESQVDLFWREISAKYSSKEFLENSNQGWAGIGMLFWKGEKDNEDPMPK